MRKKFNLFILTLDDHLPIKASPIGNGTEQNLDFGLWYWNKSLQSMIATPNSRGFYRKQLSSETAGIKPGFLHISNSCTDSSTLHFFLHFSDKKLYS